MVSALFPIHTLQVAVGFGVSKPEHAKQILSWGAEGVICGSALVKLLSEGTPVSVDLKYCCISVIDIKHYILGWFTSRQLPFQ